MIYFKYITDDVETRFDTSNYELDRSLPKGKNKNVIALMKDELAKIMVINGSEDRKSLLIRLILKRKVTGQMDDNSTKDVEVIAPLRYLSTFWSTREMPLINCEIDLILTWSANYVTVSNAVANRSATFAISDTKLYIPVVTLSTQDNVKLLHQLKSSFKRIINWNKY